MPSISKITVRPLEVRDFSFVRELAASQPNFTIPPPYVLWLLTRIGPELCLIAERPDKEAVGYLLAVPITNPPKSLYIWQLVARRTRHSQRTVVELIHCLKARVKGRKFNDLIFSAQENTTTFRALKRLVRKEASATPLRMSLLPDIVAPNEYEFSVDLRSVL